MQTELAATSDNVIRKPKRERARGLPEGFALVPKSARVTKGYLDPAHRFELLAAAQSLALAGATDFEFAQALGVSEMTLNTWKTHDPEFRAALQVPKDIADGRIEASLYHKAHGYTYRSEEIKIVDGQVVRVPTVTHVPPDTTAMIFWLKNRQRQNWTDSQELHVSGSVDLKADVRELALAMLATIKAGLAAPVIEHKEDENAEV